MRTIVVTSTEALVNAIQRASVDGTIELDALMQLVSRLETEVIQVPTPFDNADERYQSKAWPPTGRWENNEKGKDITQVVTSSDVGL